MALGTGEVARGEPMCRCGMWRRQAGQAWHLQHTCPAATSTATTLHYCTLYCYFNALLHPVLLLHCTTAPCTATSMHYCTLYCYFNALLHPVLLLTHYCYLLLQLHSLLLPATYCTAPATATALHSGTTRFPLVTGVILFPTTTILFDDFGKYLFTPLKLKSNYR